ncbi:MAG: hypothetical protein J7K53_11135 [Bacteroidales bacterium]|nr:hypothetical protein [Bacteroidales bacterium]
MQNNLITLSSTGISFAYGESIKTINAIEAINIKMHMIVMSVGRFLVVSVIVGGSFLVVYGMTNFIIVNLFKEINKKLSAVNTFIKYDVVSAIFINYSFLPLFDDK